MIEVNFSSGLIGDAAEAISGVIATNVSQADKRLVVGISGGIAVGKTTLANHLSDRVVSRGLTVEVVSTDGFLMSNAELDMLGIAHRKGFPESYDVSLIEGFVKAVGDDTYLEVRSYSHETYDIDQEPRLIERSDVLIIEGVNALQHPLAGVADLRIFLDADKAHMFDWFMERFKRLVADAASNPSGFFGFLNDMNTAEQIEYATNAWNEINMVNMVNHIDPSAEHADIVLIKDADHVFELLNLGEPNDDLPETN